MTRRPRIRPRTVSMDMDMPLPHRSAPVSPIEAVMTARFGDEPDVSVIELLVMRDVIVDAIDALPDRERWVFVAHVTEGKSFSVLGGELGISKPYAYKLHKQAIHRLQEILHDNAIIRTHLGLDGTDNGT